MFARTASNRSYRPMLGSRRIDERCAGSNVNSLRMNDKLKTNRYATDEHVLAIGEMVQTIRISSADPDTKAALDRERAEIASVLTPG